MDARQASLNNFMREIQRRQGDYDLKDLVAAREKLIATWKAAHPLAAAEASVALHPLVRTNPGRQPDSFENPEEWVNDVYNVVVRYWTHDHVFHSGSHVQIGIHTHDGTARHDWREFQAIKNQIVGPEVEAFELFPAESRLLDPSNYYTLWCFPNVKRIKVGIEERRVLDVDEALAPQRAFPKEL